MDNKKFLQMAIEKSQESVSVGGFPVGAVIVKNSEIIAKGISNGKHLNDPTSHAEIAAIREACKKLQTRDLNDSVLYSTLEPCLMCYAASTWASIPRMVFACSKERVPEKYYQGIKYNLNKINESLGLPLILVHILELEEEALKVTEDWKKNIKCP